MLECIYSNAKEQRAVCVIFCCKLPQKCTKLWKPDVDSCLSRAYGFSCYFGKFMESPEGERRALGFLQERMKKWWKLGKLWPMIRQITTKFVVVQLGVGKESAKFSSLKESYRRQRFVPRLSPHSWTKERVEAISDFEVDQVRISVLLPNVGSRRRFFFLFPRERETF